VQGVPASRRPADSPAEPASPSTVSPGHHRSAATGSVTGQRASGRVVGGVVHGEPALDGGLDRPGLEQRRPLPRNCPRVQGEPREVHDFLSPAQYGISGALRSWRGNSGRGVRCARPKHGQACARAR